MLTVFNLFGLPLIISYCYAMPQSLSSPIMIANPQQLAFHHQPNLAVLHQQVHQSAHQPALFNHQPNHFPTQLHSRTSRLVSSASSPKSTIINVRPPPEQMRSQQYSQQTSFKPGGRPLVTRQSNNNKRHKPNQRSHHHHHHLQSKITWGRCPMLQPTIEEKMKKASVITKCLEVTPIPENITRETIELHRELVAACCLKKEGWFKEALSSDDSVTKINVNNTTNNSKSILTTNLTSTSVDSPSSDNASSDSVSPVYAINTNDTLKEVGNLKASNDSSADNQKDASTTSESTVKPANATKLEQTADEKANSTFSSSKIERIDRADKVEKLEKLDNQTVFGESKHSALESDDYGEEDLNQYSEIFTGVLTYDYNKAEREIRAKKFDPDVEEKVLAFHESCRDEAQDKYSNAFQIIGQIQLYQSCMDFFISQVCGIEVTH